MSDAKKYREELLKELHATENSTKMQESDLEKLAGDEAQLDALIATLTDSNSPADATINALNQLGTISNFSPVLSEKTPEYVNALRGLLDHENTEIRIHAYGALASKKDQVAQQRLQAELKLDKAETNRAVPLDHAIRMLGFDEKALDHDDLRNIAANPPSDASLEAAVRYLPPDKKSYDVLKNVMENESTPLDTRALIPDMINNVDPQDFLNSVQKMLTAKGANHELAPYLARGVGGIELKPGAAVTMRAAPSSSSNDRQIAEQIEKTKKLFNELVKDSPEPFKNAVRTYLVKDSEHD